MPRNGSGTYTPPSNSWNPAVDDTDIDSGDWNDTLQDLADALTASLTADGQTAWTGNQNAGGYKLAGLAAGTTSGDALAYQQIGVQIQGYDALLASIAGLTFTTDNYIYGTGSNTAAVGTITAAGRALLDDADNTAQRATLGLGTAAVLDAGVSDGDVPQMDATGYPAANGSQITALTRANITSLPGPTAQVFTSDGTWTRPSGCRRIKVTATGGGGGGGGADNNAAGGGGGGAGGTAVSWIDVTSLSSAAVVVGAGGTAGADTGGNGGTGGNSTFNSTSVVAVGGSGGPGVAGAGDSAKGGSGGTPTAGGLLLVGGAGGPGIGSGSVGTISAGSGGASFWGGGGSGAPTNVAQAGGAGAAYGSGGGGGASSSGTGKAGGAGAAGVVVVEEFY